MDRTLLDNNEYSWCFACGKENEHGLHMRFEMMMINVTHIFPLARSIKATPGVCMAAW